MLSSLSNSLKVLFFLQGDNANFSLILEDILNSEGMFAVFPSVAIGRTPVIIRITDANKLDYEDPERRLFIFKVKLFFHLSNLYHIRICEFVVLH